MNQERFNEKMDELDNISPLPLLNFYKNYVEQQKAEIAGLDTLFKCAVEERNNLFAISKETYNALLWLYRRLPRAYGAPLHINIVLQQLGKIVGEDPQEFIDERSEQ